MLNYEEFQSYVEESILDFLPEKYENAIVSINTVTKNNGRELQAVCVRTQESNISPTIYLESFYEQYKNGADLDAVVNEIARVTAEHSAGPDFAENIAEDYRNFDFVKDRIVLTVVNTEKNREMLKNTPHTEKEDLSFIYKVMIGESSVDGVATITIKEEHMAVWGVTVEDLHSLAMKNSQEKLPAKVQSMNDIMLEMLGRDGLPEEVVEAMIMNMPPENQMYVISNSNSVNGASAIFYSDALAELSDRLGGVDLFVLPSSVHEVIAVSTDMGTPEMLAQMVQEVNGTQVSLEEQLSDHVYKFDAKTRELALADTTVEELKKSTEQSIDVQAATKPRHHR